MSWTHLNVRKRNFSNEIPRIVFNLLEENYKPNGYVVFILTAIYMAIVSILLVNLLIAMFRSVFLNFFSSIRFHFRFRFRLATHSIVFKVTPIEFGNFNVIH